MWNENLDDPPIPAGTVIFSGVRESLTPSLIDDASLARAINAVFDNSGTGASRPGTGFIARPQAAPAQGGWFYNIPGFKRALAVVNGKLYHLSAALINTTPTEITGITPALSTSNRVVFSQLVDKVYMSDAVNLYEIFWTGTAWSVTHVPNFDSGGSALPGFSILTTCVSGAAAFRLVVSGVSTTDNDFLYVSDPLLGTKIKALANVRVGRGSGDPIRAVKPSQTGQLVTVKANSVWVVEPGGATLADWGIRAISEDVGTVAGASVCLRGQEVFFLAHEGVVSLKRLLSTDGVNEQVYISNDIKPTIDRINWEYAHKANAMIYGDYYLLAVPLGDSTLPDSILAYNTVTGRWSGEWTGLCPTCSIVTEFNDRRRVLIGDSEGRILRLDPSLSRDQVSVGVFNEIQTIIETKAWNFGSTDSLKQFFTAAVKFEKSTGTVNVELLGDGREASMIEANARTNQLPQLPVQLPFSLAADTHLRRSWYIRDQPRAIEARLRLTSTNGYLRIREVKLQAWIDTPEVIK